MTVKKNQIWGEGRSRKIEGRQKGKKRGGKERKNLSTYQLIHI